MSGDDQILRRHFIAIATDTYEANGTFVKLDVDKEVGAIRRWLTDSALGDLRRFDDHRYAALAHRPSLDQIRKMLTKKGSFSEADAVVVYVTGHGIVGKDKSHLIVLHDTDPQAPSDALRTADLVLWLAAHTGLTQVMLIIDVCQAGQLDNNLPAELTRDLPEEWFVIVTAQVGVNARLGAFTDAVEATMNALRYSADAATRAQPYLHWYDQFIEPVFDWLEENKHPRPDVLKVPYKRPWVYLPNPGFDAGQFEPVVTNPARRDLAFPSQEMTAHWAVRAPVVADGGPVFTGRARLMQTLIDFTQGEVGTLVVTGRAGCGKSASLARLVTCSDPDFRREHASALAVAKPVPPHNAVDIAILATGKTAEQIAQQLGYALGIEGPEPQASTALEGWVQAIVAAIELPERTFTLVVDGFDEAIDSGAVLTTLLTQLNSPERQRLRLLVGVRSSGDADTADAGIAGEGTRDLASTATMMLGAREVRADDDEFWEPHDLAEYVGQLLRQPDSPYSRETAASVADAIEAKAARSYFLAGLTARALLERDDPLAVGDPRLDELLAKGSAELVSQDLRMSVPEPEDRQRAVHMLRASALAEGRGVPVRTIWPMFATAIADGVAFGDRDIAWLLGHRLSGYLVRDTEDGSTVYRPFHQELRRVLREGTSLDAGSPGADLVSEAEAHRRITSSLIPLATWGPK